MAKEIDTTIRCSYCNKERWKNIFGTPMCIDCAIKILTYGSKENRDELN